MSDAGSSKWERKGKPSFGSARPNKFFKPERGSKTSYPNSRSGKPATEKGEGRRTSFRNKDESPYNKNKGGKSSYSTFSKKQDERKSYGKSEGRSNFSEKDKEDKSYSKGREGKALYSKREDTPYNKEREGKAPYADRVQKNNQKDREERTATDATSNARKPSSFRSTDKKNLRPENKSRNKIDSVPEDKRDFVERKYRPRKDVEAKSSKGTSESNYGSKSTDEIRLNRFIANAGICSRRDADSLILAGEITVNGKTVTEMGTKVKPGDEVRYNNKKLKREKMVYVLLNKPKDFITTTDDPENRKTIMQLVEGAGNERIYPVGRLDRNTTGLILLTNDGDLADKLSHPSNNIKKLYQVDLDKPIVEEDFIKIQEGVMLEDGVAEVDQIAVVSSDRTSLGLQIHSGKNRIVRRIFEHLGYDVVKLDRVMYAGLDKKDLPRGKWRMLSEKEIIHLKYMK
ncbi:MAG: rRNA pseudouridine synthase [Bacteroidota bacterium]|nr:rRNA pseudouridine synthase [Bacteroidota bacterium]